MGERLAGDRSRVMGDQLEHLIDAVALPNVTLQVLLFGVGVHAGMDGEFSILRYRDPADPDVVYIESAAGQRFDESAEVAGQYNLIFDHLRAAALNPAESIRTLADAKWELQQQLQEPEGRDGGSVPRGMAEEHP
jgi:hypothetical protein